MWPVGKEDTALLDFSPKITFNGIQSYGVETHRVVCES